MFLLDHDGDVEEDYVPRLVATSVKESISEGLNSINECTVSASIGDYSIVEKNVNITAEEFVKKHDINSVYVKIIFNGTPLQVEQIVSALENTSSKLGVNLTVRCYVLNEESYEKCREDFLEYPYVGSTVINSYFPQNEFLVHVRNGKCDVDENSLKNVLGV